jgi:serine/threonine-protein kinase
MYTPKAGDVLGNYQIERLMRHGGMAWVALALDPHGQRVALKIARLRGDESDETINHAIRREAEILQRLDHKRVVRILPIAEDVRDTQGNRRFCFRAATIHGAPWVFAMEPLAGETLAEYLKATGPLSISDMVHIAGNLSLGLYHAHATGVAHNDLKADNVLFRQRPAPGARPDPVLIDFGIAASLKRHQAQAGSTFVMAPERLRAVRGESAPEQVADAARSDVWSLGVLIYHMLTNRLPFPALVERSLTSQILKATPEPITDFNPRVSPDVNAFVLQRCLAKQAHVRASLLEVIRFLEGLRNAHSSSLGRLNQWRVGGQLPAA